MVYQLKYVSPVNQNVVTFQGPTIGDVARKFNVWAMHIDLEPYIDYAMCEELVAANATSEDVHPKKRRGATPSGNQLSASGVFNAARAAFGITMGKVATPEEAARRASICSTCQFKTTGVVGGCRACGGSRILAQATNIVSKTLGHHVSTPPSIVNSFCSLCSCDLSLLVQLQSITLKHETPLANAARPAYCWLRLPTP
jgi:hypothetical protein